MPLTAVLVAAAATGAAAFALTPRMRTIAASESRWLRSWLHVPLAALAGAGAASLATSPAETVAFALLGLAGALLVVIDLAEHRLPDAIVGPMYPAFFAALTVAAAVDGVWNQFGRAAAAAAVLVTGYFILAFVSPSGLGLGDVKLAGLLGAFLGWQGWQHVLLGTAAAFVLGGLVAVALIVVARANSRTAFAFGPWMLGGAAVGAAYGSSLLA